MKPQDTTTQSMTPTLSLHHGGAGTSQRHRQLHAQRTVHQSYQTTPTTGQLALLPTSTTPGLTTTHHAHAPSTHSHVQTSYRIHTAQNKLIGRFQPSALLIHRLARHAWWSQLVTTYSSGALLRSGSSSCSMGKSRVSCRYHSSLGSMSLKVGLHNNNNQHTYQSHAQASRCFIC